MVTTFVLINVPHGKINEVAEQLAGIEGIAEVYSVAGRYDLVALIRVKTNEQMADLVPNRMLNVDGIEKSETLIAFRAYSRHDLEAMFSLGFDEGE